MKLHGHPQLTAYASPVQWPTDSAQSHWTPANNSPDPTTRTGHTHLDVTFPRYAEIAEPFTTTFAVKLFRVAGRMTGIFGGQVRDVVWDATGAATLPDLIGDPTGLRTWTGHFTIDPGINLGNYVISRHGWAGTAFTVRTAFDNGAETRTSLIEPFYSMVDLALPESPLPQSGIRVSAYADGNGAGGPQFGTGVMEYPTMLPVATIRAPWSVQGFFYNYASPPPDLPNGTFELRLDPDLHNGIPGTILESRSVQGDHNFLPSPLVLDPARMGTGVHKLAAFWTQPGARDETLSTLLVVNIDVDASGAPPPPPPPPPPPVETKRPVGGVLQLFIGELPQPRFFVCPTPTSCVELVVK